MMYILRKYKWIKRYFSQNNSKESKIKKEEKRRWKIKGTVQRDKNNMFMVQWDICLIVVRALFGKFF
jgi:hypothetical protein